MSRIEAISIAGSMLCFPENLPGLSVLEPIPNQFSLVTCSEIKVFTLNSFTWEKQNFLTQCHCLQKKLGTSSGLSYEICQTGGFQSRTLHCNFKFSHLHLLSADTRHKACQSQRRYSCSPCCSKG